MSALIKRGVNMSPNKSEIHSLIILLTSLTIVNILKSNNIHQLFNIF